MGLSEAVLIALIGLAGAVIGSIATIAAGIVSACLKKKEIEKLEKPRKALLLSMLNTPDRWRSLKTLSHVVGLEEQETKNLLLAIGARASEDGQAKWGLLSRNPLPDRDWPD